MSIPIEVGVDEVVCERRIGGCIVLTDLAATAAIEIRERRRCAVLAWLRLAGRDRDFAFRSLEGRAARILGVRGYGASEQAEGDEVVAHGFPPAVMVVRPATVAPVVAPIVEHRRLTAANCARAATVRRSRQRGVRHGRHARCDAEQCAMTAYPLPFLLRVAVAAAAGLVAACEGASEQDAARAAEPPASGARVAQPP
ncbi:hypothetical protein, partial [Dokdonella sp.]|uniref:hypothetical protein n=1 Tax=Dokdonella sp. TaxID=2291710 RepID=UPI002F42EAEE